MPPLGQWLPRYALPSVLSIVATYAMLRITQRRRLRQEVSSEITVPELSGAVRSCPELSGAGRMAACGIIGTAVVLLASSALDIQLGLPTFLAGIATAVPVLTRARCGPWSVAKNISWGVLPLVAGLFVLVEALEKTGVTNDLAALLHDLVQRSAILAAWASGLGLAVGCNLVNNLPAGLVAGRVVEIAGRRDRATGVDYRRCYRLGVSKILQKSRCLPNLHRLATFAGAEMIRTFSGASRGLQGRAAQAGAVPIRTRHCGGAGAI